MKLSDIILTDAIVPQLKAKTRDEAIVELVDSLADAGAIAKKDVKEFTDTITKREKQATTGIGKGVALPHAKIKGIKKPIGTIGMSSDGIDFSSLDSKPVYSVFLMLSSSELPDEHLQAMECLFKHIQRDQFRKFLRQVQTQEEVIELIKEEDELG